MIVGESKFPGANVAFPTVRICFGISSILWNGYPPLDFRRIWNPQTHRRLPNLVMQCPPSASRTKPPGSPGRTIPTIGQTSSRLFGGFTPKWYGKFLQAKSSAFSSAIAPKKSRRGTSSNGAVAIQRGSNFFCIQRTAVGHATAGRFF